MDHFIHPAWSIDRSTAQELMDESTAPLRWQGRICAAPHLYHEANHLRALLSSTREPLVQHDRIFIKIQHFGKSQTVFPNTQRKWRLAHPHGPRTTLPPLIDPIWSLSSTRHHKTTVAAVPALMFYPLPAQFSHWDVKRLVCGTQLIAS